MIIFQKCLLDLRMPNFSQLVNYKKENLDNLKGFSK